MTVTRHAKAANAEIIARHRESMFADNDFGTADGLAAMRAAFVP